VVAAFWSVAACAPSPVTPPLRELPPQPHPASLPTVVPPAATVVVAPSATATSTAAPSAAPAPIPNPLTSQDAQLRYERCVVHGKTNECAWALEHYRAHDHAQRYQELLEIELMFALSYCDNDNHGRATSSVDPERQCKRAGELLEESALEASKVTHRRRSLAKAWCKKGHTRLCANFKKCPAGSRWACRHGAGGAMVHRDMPLPRCAGPVLRWARPCAGPDPALGPTLRWARPCAGPDPALGPTLRWARHCAEPDMAQQPAAAFDSSETVYGFAPRCLTLGGSW
jgi:hypothetical protein